MTDFVLRRLTTDEFDQFFQVPMLDVTESANALVDIWAYVDSIDESDLGDITAHDVSFVYRHPNDRWEHVLVDTCAENVHLVIVLDRQDATIIGHHLLNLNALYNLGN